MRFALAASLFVAVAVSVAAAPSFSKDTPDGKRLYAKYCADCHGPLHKSDVAGATLKEIKYAVTDRMCGEKGAIKLTGAELGAVERALAAKAR